MTNSLTKARSPTDIMPVVSWDQLSDQFIRTLDAKPPTVKLYRKALTYFLSWLDGTQPTRESILDYKRYLEHRKLGSYTINAYLTSLRQFFAWLESEQVFPNIAGSIKGKKQPDQSKDALTGIQCRKLLDSISVNGIVSQRNYAILNLLIRTGLRTIELCRANIGDIRDQDNAKVLWVQGKGRDEKDKFVLLTAESLEPILDYIGSRKAVKDDDPLFVSHSNNHAGQRLGTRSIRKAVLKCLNNAGLKTDRISAHSLRHSFVTLAIENGADPQQVQASARHGSIGTTMRYYHNRDRIKNAAKKVIKF